MRIAFIFLVFFAGWVNAHEIKPAYLKMNEASSGFDVVWKQPIREGVPVAIEPVFPSHCQEVSRGLGENTGMALVKRWVMDCGDIGLHQQTVTISGLNGSLADVFVDIRFSNGNQQTAVLKPGSASLLIDAGATADNTGYFWLGVEHLLLGYDHILFVIGLVLLIRTPLNLIKVVTSFTVAHSVTLALSTLGVVSLTQASVEAVIALSIAFLAVELVNSNRDRVAGHEPTSIMLRYPWLITFVFGLLHGFGFAGALSEIGLPKDAIAMPLLLFNVGVEVGQLLIVAATLLILLGWKKLAFSDSIWIKNMPAYGIGVLAMFWFIERSLATLQV